VEKKQKIGSSKTRGDFVAPGNYYFIGMPLANFPKNPFSIILEKKL
jgi:hypothetical protein